MGPTSYLAMASLLFVLLLQFEIAVSQATISVTAVEGRSINVAVLCDLDREFHPLYWEIEGRVYDLYSIPDVFLVMEHEALLIPEVDRRMNGWRFQCFTIDPNMEGNLNPGQITLLTVYFDPSAG